MKTIGIIGGLGPEATVDYYKEIIGAFNKINSNGSLNYPEIILFSVNMSKFIGFLSNGENKKAAEYIASCIHSLENAGVDFVAISANTPHLLFNEIQEKVQVPLISIVETCKSKAMANSLRRCGLLGTKFTMNGGFYTEVFKTSGIEIIIPEDNEIEKINEILFTELELGIIKDETRNRLLQIVLKMIERDGIDSIILGCTEFPLMFKDDKYLGIPFLNTTRLHVQAIVEYCLKDN